MEQQEATAQAAAERTRDAASVQSGGCASCGAGKAATGPASYVYAVGNIQPRFPRLSVEKEFAQATGRAETAGLSDHEALRRVLSERQNRYLVKQLCWVMTIQGLDTYILLPRDASDFDLLVESLRPSPRATDIDIVIGMRGPVAPAELCNGLMLPIVLFSQIYSFDFDSLIRSIPAPPDRPKKEFASAAGELLSRIVQLTDNAGASDDHRALNYLAVRYPAIFAKAAEQFARNFSLTAVDVRSSTLSSARRMVDVIFSYTDRTTDFTEKFFVRVDVTDEFPFLAAKLSPYFDR